MTWYASVAKVGHSTSGLTTTITFRVTQRVDGNSYDAVGWDVRWNASTGASGPLRFEINKNQTVTRDFSVSVEHNSSTGVAPNVTVTVSNLREGNCINSVVSKSASFQPPNVNVTKVPQVSNVKLTRNSDSQLTINWTNNGNENTIPNRNYVDIKTDYFNLESYNFDQHLKDMYTDTTTPSTARILINNNDANILHFANSSHTLTLPAEMSAVSFSKGKEELGYYYLLSRYGDSEIQHLIKYAISSTREGLRYYADIISNKSAIRIPTLVQGKIYKNNELPLQIDNYVTTIYDEPFRGSQQTFKLHPLSIQIKI